MPTDPKLRNESINLLDKAMTELVELYSKGIKRKLENYWAAWLPGTRFAIGNSGILNGYLFEKVGTLDELNLKY